MGKLLHRRRCFVPFVTAIALALALVACQAGRGGRARPELVRQAIAAGNYEEGESLAAQWLTSVERDEGPESLATARALDLCAEAALKNGKAATPSTMALAERAVRLKERHLGRDHVETAVSLHDLGALLLQRGESSAGFGVLVDRFGVPWEINCAQPAASA